MLPGMGATLRPKFELTISEPAERLLERMERRLRAADCALCGVVTPSRIELQVPPARKHLWSPELRVEVWQDGAACRLTGAYGPHPHVWTMFLAVYAGLSFVAFLALIFVLAEYTLGEPLQALYLLPALVLLAVGARSLAFVGQGLAKPQIEELRAFLDDTIARADAAESAPRRSGVRALKPESEQDGGSSRASG